jgi:Tfp pilus assembly protein PilV
MVEVMVSLTVIAVALMAMFSAMSSAVQVSSTTATRDRVKSAIHNLAQQLDTAVQANTFDNVVATNGTIQTVAGVPNSGTAPIITTTVLTAGSTGYPTGASPTLKAVAITATWQGGSTTRICYYVPR